MQNIKQGQGWSQQLNDQDQKQWLVERSVENKELTSYIDGLDCQKMMILLDTKGREHLQYTVQSIPITNNKYLRYQDFLKHFQYMDTYLQLSQDLQEYIDFFENRIFRTIIETSLYKALKKYYVEFSQQNEFVIYNLMKYYENQEQVGEIKHILKRYLKNLDLEDYVVEMIYKIVKLKVELELENDRGWVQSLNIMLESYCKIHNIFQCDRHFMDQNIQLIQVDYDNLEANVYNQKHWKDIKGQMSQLKMLLEIEDGCFQERIIQYQQQNIDQNYQCKDKRRCFVAISGIEKQQKLVQKISFQDDVEIQNLQQLLFIVQLKPCVLKQYLKLVKLSCCQIMVYLLELIKYDRLFIELPAGSFGQKTIKRKKHNQKHRNINKLHFDERIEYCKCGVNDSCTNCGCKKFGACTKYCGCQRVLNRNCVLMYFGCLCTLACESQQCPCYKSNRQCDPVLCLKCGQNQKKEVCQNMKLLFNVDCDVKVGDSQICQGLGLFADQKIMKYQFIIEYKGYKYSSQFQKVIDICDEKYKDINYKFELNCHEIVDSKYYGNKSRFINQQNDEKQINCLPKYILVEGKQVIGIFAIRDIKQGEELIMNYGDTFS